MLLFIAQNAMVILCTLLCVISCVIAFRRMRVPAVTNIEQGVLPKSFRQLWSIPLKSLHLAFVQNGPIRRIFLIFFTLLFAMVTLFALENSFIPLWLAVLLFLPLTFFCVFVFYYCLWMLSILFHRLLNVKQRRLNVIFSFCAVILLLLILNFYITNASEKIFGFSLIISNLFFCYLLIAFSLYHLLQEATRKGTKLSLHNLWKVAFLEIFFFLLILSMLSYAGYLFFSDAYQITGGGYSLFDAFYYVVVTFGTVGYGDVVPMNFYTKFIAILIVFSSIACLTIMLSSLLSVTHRSRKDKEN